MKHNKQCPCGSRKFFCTQVVPVSVEIELDKREIVGENNYTLIGDIDQDYLEFPPRGFVKCFGDYPCEREWKSWNDIPDVKNEIEDKKEKK